MFLLLFPIFLLMQMYFISNQNDISTQHCVLFLFSFLFCSVHADGWAAMGLWGESSYLPRMPHNVLININKLAAVCECILFMNKNMNQKSKNIYFLQILKICSFTSCNFEFRAINSAPAAIQRVGQDGHLISATPTIQVQIHKYKCTYTNLQVKMHKHKYMNTNTNT